MERSALRTSHLDALRQAKWAYTTRHVEPPEAVDLLPPPSAGRAGDLLLARVQTLGQHDGVQLRNGRRAQLFPGDAIVVCLGSRYAPDQFEGLACLRGVQADLLAAGGVAGTVRHRHARMRPATCLSVLGALAGTDGAPLNLRDHALPPGPGFRGSIPVIGVVGSSMNAGKTTACAALILGLQRAGLRVGAAKLTGTGSFGDVQSYVDAGAAMALDFTDAGHASTYQVAVDELERIGSRLLGELERGGCDVAVVEIADGLYQRETASLLATASLRDWVGGLVFAAGDALSAVAGVRWLHEQNWRVLAFSGLVSASPLAVAEASAVLRQAGISTPCWSRDDLSQPALARSALLLRGPVDCALPL